MSPTKEQHTFISYSRSNMDFALRLARALKESGYPVWVDQMDIPVGARWDDELEIALDACGIFLVILTPASITSENVKDEIGYAIDHSKRILPVLLEECNIPLRLRRFQHVDFTTMKFEDGLEVVKQLLYNFIRESKPPQSLISAIENREKRTDDQGAEKERHISLIPTTSEPPSQPKDARPATQKGRREYFEQKQTDWEQSKAKEEQAAKPVQDIPAQPIVNSISEAIPEASSIQIVNSNQSIWKFGKAEIIRGLIGLAIVSITSILFRQAISSGFLVFFALAYGPWVGLITGLFGSLIPHVFPDSTINPLVFVTLGLMAGLFTKKFNNFRDYRDILWAIGLGEVTAFTGFIIFGLIPAAAYITDWEIETISFLIMFASNLVILPILMVTFAKTVNRAEFSDFNISIDNLKGPTVWIIIGVLLAGVIFFCVCGVLAYLIYTQLPN